MTKADEIFVSNVKEILEDGYDDYGQKVRPYWLDRDAKQNEVLVPAHTKYLLGRREKYDLEQEEWPIISARPILFNRAIGEVLWIWRDESSNLALLRDKYNVTWWDEWESKPLGTIGQRYGATVGDHKIMKKIREQLRRDPFSRRIIGNLWQYEDLNLPGGLDPCVYQVQFFVTQGKAKNEKLKLHMIVYQRSSDYITAGHINRMQYAALQLLLAVDNNMDVGTLTWYTGNLHIYDRHFEIAEKMIAFYDRAPAETINSKPRLVLAEGVSFEEAMPEHFKMLDYSPGPQFKIPLAV